MPGKAPTAMTMLSLLYVSRFVIGGCEADVAVDQIVATARRVNPDRNLTGALIFAGSNFAQILEGPRDAVEAMMALIQSDQRHDNVLIVDRAAIAQRRFPDWSMAYFGRVQYIERHITQLFDSRPIPDRNRTAKLLADLIYRFSRN